jgi:hypothetical protein
MIRLAITGYIVVGRKWQCGVSGPTVRAARKMLGNHVRSMGWEATNRSPPLNSVTLSTEIAKGDPPMPSIEATIIEKGVDY